MAGGACGETRARAVDLRDDPIDATIQNAAPWSATQAFAGIHTPSMLEQVEGARTRFRYEEAFVLQMILAMRRAAVAGSPATARPGRPDGLLAAVQDRLPFTLTDGQRTAVDEIEADLARTPTDAATAARGGGCR